ncbi:MAG: hypothetical protein HY719_16200, partial [Planctomycetes bacterium]|nr:hypothetical protein [Planctomycetota bacterium]
MNSLFTFLGANNEARLALLITTEPAGHETEFEFGFKPTDGVMPPVGDFQPGGAEVTFSEPGDFEIAARCKDDVAPLTFGYGPHVHIVDLLGVEATDGADPSNFVDFPRRDPTDEALVVAPGSLIRLDTLTDETGHEQDVWFEVSPAETATPSSGVFPAGGGPVFVTVGFDPVYTIRVYHDKDGSWTFSENDPFIEVNVVTPVAIDHLRIFINSLEVLPVDEPANGHVGEQFVVTGWGVWSGLDGEPFTGDDVIMDEVPITAAELNTVLADSPNPGGGPPVLTLSAASASIRARSQRSAAGQGGGGSAGGSNAGGQSAGGGVGVGGGAVGSGAGTGTAGGGGMGAGNGAGGASGGGGAGTGGNGAAAGGGGASAGSSTGTGGSGAGGDGGASGGAVGGAAGASGGTGASAAAATVAGPPGLGGNPPPGLPADGPPGLGGEPIPGVGNPVNSPAVIQKRIFDIFPVSVESYVVTLTAINAGTCDVEFTY